MKRTMYLLLSVALLLSSCKKDDLDDFDENPVDLTEDSAGEISGLGDNGGNLGGTTFVLPEGIEVVGKVMGFSENSTSSGVNSSTSFPKSEILVNRMNETQTTSLRASTAYDVIIGSGGLVTVKISLKNTTSDKIVVNFPAGLIFESVSGEFQNGILMKRCKATVPANKTYDVVLHLYCGNLSRHVSDPSAEYKWPIRTNSARLMELCELLKNKKINYEEYSGLGIIQYFVVIITVQSVVWDISDSDEGLSSSNRETINNLPKS